MRRRTLRLLTLVLLLLLLVFLYRQIVVFWQQKIDDYILQTEHNLGLENDYQSMLEKELQRRVSWLFYQGQGSEVCSFLQSRYQAISCEFLLGKEQSAPRLIQEAKFTGEWQLSNIALLNDEQRSLNSLDWHWATDDFSLRANLHFNYHWLRDMLFSQAVLQANNDWFLAGLLPTEDAEFRWFNFCGIPRRELEILGDQADISTYSGSREGFSTTLSSGYYYKLQPFDMGNFKFYWLLIIDTKQIRHLIWQQFLHTLLYVFLVLLVLFFLWRLKGHYVAFGCRLIALSLLSLGVFLWFMQKVAPPHTSYTRDWYRYEQERLVLSAQQTEQIILPYYEVLPQLPFSASAFYLHKGLSGSFLFHVEPEKLSGVPYNLEDAIFWQPEFKLWGLSLFWFFGFGLFCYRDRKYLAVFRQNIQKFFYEEESDLFWTKEQLADYPELCHGLLEVFLQVQKREQQQKYLSAEVLRSFAEKLELPIFNEEIEFACAALFFYPVSIETLDKMLVKDYFLYYNKTLNLFRECVDKFSGLSFYEDGWCYGIVFRTPNYDVSLQRAMVCGLEVFRRLTDMDNSFAWQAVVQKGQLSLKVCQIDKRQEIIMAGSIFHRLQLAQNILQGESGLFIPQEFFDESQFLLFDKRELANKPFFSIIGVHDLAEHLSLFDVDDEKLQVTALELAYLHKEEWVLKRILESLHNFSGTAKEKAFMVIADYIDTDSRRLIFDFFCKQAMTLPAVLNGEQLLSLCEQSDFLLSKADGEILLSLDTGLQERVWELLLRRCPENSLILRLENEISNASRRLQALFWFQLFVTDHRFCGVTSTGEQLHDTTKYDSLTKLIDLIPLAGQDLSFVLSLLAKIPYESDTGSSFLVWKQQNPRAMERLIAYLTPLLTKMEHDSRAELFLLLANWKLREFFDVLVLQYQNCLVHEVRQAILQTLRKLGADAFILFGLQIWRK